MVHREPLFDYFDQQRPEIQALFDARRFKDAIEPMAKAVEHFKHLLYKLNGETDREKDPESLPLKPINIKERLDYLDANLKQYHAFLQLETLYQEVEKLYAKKAIMDKMTSSI